ncbi:MAG: hypothetical protein K0U72_08590 [Gammaproteobacteria bacterium]|nr:hypothetical protein [Gammaproteobacteria bacterium]
MRIALLIACLVLFTADVRAQEVEEIVVTGTLVGSSVPGKHLRRPADNILLRVQIVNDSRDADQREEEIHKTLSAAISAAARNDRIELSSVTDSGFVLPLTKANYQIDLHGGQRPDTSQAYFRAKSAVPDSLDDGEALVLELKRFVAGLKMVGRTEVFVNGDVEVSIVNPSQYRAEAIRLFAEDVQTVTGSLGDDYRVIVNGIDKPIEWARAGSLSVAIYIPYEYTVVPTTINGVTIIPDY